MSTQLQSSRAVWPAGMRTATGGRPLATFLGVFSLGLGAAELLCGRWMGDLTGVRLSPLVRAYGVREIASGVGVLTAENPAGWLWARVAGDLLDLATLAAALPNASAADRTRLTASAAAVLGVTVLDVLCAREHSRHPR